MENPLLSIIVPVYNVEKYLDQCISSIINQTYKNIEIILVNDGSTDSSGEICKKYAEKDGRIRLLSQKNLGLTRARKNGAALITGEYLAFVDADDYIDANLYYELMEQQDGYDLIVYKWFREEENKVRYAGDKLAVGEYKTSEDMDFLFRHLVNVSTSGGAVNLKSGLVPFVWNKLFKAEIARSVFHEIDEDIRFFEDCDFTYRYLSKSKCVLITDIYGYHYRIRSDSICHTIEGDGGFLENAWRLYKSLYPAFAAHAKADILLPQLQIKIAAILEKAPYRMGFSKDAMLQRIVFPFLNMLNGKKVVLYGAGRIGVLYWHQIVKWHVCELVLWIDKFGEEYQKGGFPVQAIDELKNIKYDYIVLAESNSNCLQTITDELLAMGAERNQILWKYPLEM